MKPRPTSVEQYLAELPEDRRAIVAAVRDVIRKNLDSGFEEGIQYGMIGYYVPHRLHPAGYHCDPKQPLPLAALGSTKQGISLHLMALYSGGGEESDYGRWFKQAWKKSGKKLDMGKACIRFKSLDAVPLEVIGQAFSRITAKQYIAACTAMSDRSIKRDKSKSSNRSSSARKSASKSA